MEEETDAPGARDRGRGKLRTKCHDRAATDPIAAGRATTRVRQTTCLFLKPGTKQRALSPSWPMAPRLARADAADRACLQCFRRP
jgi:hypothetical protein